MINYRLGEYPGTSLNPNALMLVCVYASVRSAVDWIHVYHTGGPRAIPAGEVLFCHLILNFTDVQHNAISSSRIKATNENSVYRTTYIPSVQVAKIIKNVIYSTFSAGLGLPMLPRSQTKVLLTTFQYWQMWEAS